METVEYATGRLVDLFGDGAERTVLMWHGAQRNARTSMRPLAERVAAHGLAVVVPDWDSHADDRGRADLLASLEFARSRTGSGYLMLVGWSMGGLAAAGATIHAESLGVDVSRAVCLAGAFVVADPLSGAELPEDLAAYDGRPPFTLLHGVADDVVPVDVSRAFAARLRRVGWPVDLVELPADHGNIAGAMYDPLNDRYLPGEDPQTLAVAGEVAARIADAAVE